MMTSIRPLPKTRKIPAALRSSVPLVLALILLLFASLGAFAQTDGTPPPKVDPYAEPVPTTLGDPVLPDADNPADPEGTLAPPATEQPAPAPPGIPLVYVSGGRLAVDGHSLQHVGVNEYDYVYEDTDQWNDTYTLRQGGVKQIRVFLANTNYNVNDTIAALNTALGIAWNRGIRLTVAFTNFYWSLHYGHGGRGGHVAVPGDDGFYTLHCGPSCGDGDVITMNRDWMRTGYPQHYKSFVQAVAAAFQNDGRIFAWEIGNEIKDPDLDPEVTIAFYSDMARTIKVADPTHLVSPGIICTTWLGLTTPDQKNRFYQSLDYVTEHHYLNHVVGGDLSDDQLARSLGKPLVIEEFGADQHFAPYATDHDHILPDVIDFFDAAYTSATKPADSVMVWGVDFGSDHGSADANSGPLEQHLGNEYLQLWRENADWGRPSPRYSDVPPGDTFYSYIECLSSHRAVSGHFDWANDSHNDEYHPGATVTRADAVKALVRAMGLNLIFPNTATFTDVPRSSQYFRYVETAVAYGIISGYADRTFRPDNPLTRGQMCKVVVLGGMVRYGWQINTSGGPHFTDVPTTQTFYPYIETAYNRQIVSGYGSYFLPDNLTTRGQFAKMLSQAISCR